MVILGYVGFGILCIGVLVIAYRQATESDEQEKKILAALARRNSPENKR